MWPTNVYTIARLDVIAIASSWIFSIVFSRTWDSIITIVTIFTMEEIDEASSYLSTGQLYLNSGRYFGTMVESSSKSSPLLSSSQLSLDADEYFATLVSPLGFIFILSFKGLSILWSTSCLFCLFSLSIFWISVGCVLLSLSR